MIGEEEIDKLYGFALKIKPHLMELLREKAPELTLLYERRYTLAAPHNPTIQRLQNINEIFAAYHKLKTAET